MLSIPSLSSNRQQSQGSVADLSLHSRKFLKPINPIDHSKIQTKHRFRLARLELGKAPSLQQKKFVGQKRRDYISVDLKAHDRVL